MKYFFQLIIICATILFKEHIITDSTVLFVKNASLNGKRKIIVIIGGIIIIFSEAESAQAMGTNPPPPQQTVVFIISRC